MWLCRPFIFGARVSADILRSYVLDGRDTRWFGIAFGGVFFGVMIRCKEPRRG